MLRPAPIFVRQHSLARPRGTERPVSLAEVLDRILNKGVVVAGEIVISIAGIDLVYVALNLLVASVPTARRHTLEGTGNDAR